MFVRTKFNVCKNQKITRTTFAVINTLVSQYSKCKKTFLILPYLKNIPIKILPPV